MTNKLDAGFSGPMPRPMTALLSTCLACTSLQDLSSYSAGDADSAPPPGYQAPVAESTGDTPAPPPDAGAPAASAVEAQNPAELPLVPTDSVDAVDDCTGPGEFTQEGSASCYRLADTVSSWRDARDLCQEWGGDLAKVESPEENTLLAEGSDEDVWLGASDFEDEGNFRWFDGDDAEGPWAPAQPDNFEGRENCVELRAMDDRWNDVPCTSEKLPLCERELAGAAP
jgi:hypothetical protein